MNDDIIYICINIYWNDGNLKKLNAGKYEVLNCGKSCQGGTFTVNGRARGVL